MHLEAKYKHFINDVPLKIIEMYYYRNLDALNFTPYIDFNHKVISDKKILDFYVELEEFYQDVFSLASQIASYYNLEIKINNKNKTHQEYI